MCAHVESGVTVQCLESRRADDHPGPPAEAAGRVEPKPTGRELREWLRPKLGTAHNAMLDALLAADGQRLSDDELSAASGYSSTGHFTNVLGNLRSIGAAQGYAKDGGTKAADVFFE